MLPPAQPLVAVVVSADLAAVVEAVAAAAKCTRASSCSSPPVPMTCCFPARWPAAKPFPDAPRPWMCPLGKGHIVMFAIRPFWRWQTQGSFMLAFNAIMNWDHLDAGKPAPATPSTTAAGGGQ